MQVNYNTLNMQGLVKSAWWKPIAWGLGGLGIGGVGTNLIWGSDANGIELEKARVKEEKERKDRENAMFEKGRNSRFTDEQNSILKDWRARRDAGMSEGYKDALMYGGGGLAALLGLGGLGYLGYRALTDEDAEAKKKKKMLAQSQTQEYQEDQE